MNQAVLFNFKVDRENQQIRVERSFNAPRDMVWAAWTQAEILDQWWGPAPWRTETKFMDFSEGGYWHYAMVGPNGEKHWSRADYLTIRAHEHFTAEDGFCDEEGKPDTTLPRNRWENDFSDYGQSTVVNILLTFNSLSDLETIIKMGFKEGFTAGLENLDRYIEAQFKLRQQNRNNNMARVTTYLNFAGNTEEAFNFYRTVFRSEFINGIQRFGDLPADPNNPPMAESVKQMVLHIELPIMGGHILMGTDAPEEMGFKVTNGNNMHINLEPQSREEAKRLFDELSEGGKVEMPIQDMFWGAYYGSFQDRFGINWMINYQNKSS
ncbi:MAG: SRPBCC domain-containing protein [Saprospiraceae bacterium]|nr:SRPBCC domain-containing protein [Saprospiraceae bacterium]